MVKWYIGSRRLASMVHARSYISFNACNTLCMCTQKKRCTFTSNEKQLYWKKVEWIRYWMDEIQTQRAMASTAVMCWKWRKNPPTETARTERGEKISFGKTKPLQIAFDTHWANFVSFRCAFCACVRLSVNVYTSARTHASTTLFCSIAE